MIKKLIISFIFFLMISTSCHKTYHHNLVIKNANIIDVKTGEILENRTITIDSNKISAIYTSEKIFTDSTRIIDARGKFMIPGLWDMHVHWFDESYWPLFIANGITGIRQMWGNPMLLDWRRRVETGELVAPRQVVVSPLIEGEHQRWPGSVKITDAATARQFVRDFKAAGYEAIKFIDTISGEVFFAIAEESKNQGIPFGGHIPDAVTTAEASNAGMRFNEHLWNVNVDCSDADSLAEASALFATFIKNDTWQCPTFSVNRAMLLFGDPILYNAQRMEYIPLNLRNYWKNPGVPIPASEEERREHERWYRGKFDITREMHKAGVRLLAGTDTPNPYCYPGFSLHDELKWMVESGLTPLEALQTATLNPAEFLGRTQNMGTVATGKIADLVLLNANPLEDIAHTTDIQAVILNGRYFDRNALDAMLTDIRSQNKAQDEFHETLEQKGAAAAIRFYRARKAQHDRTVPFPEDFLNDVGYSLLSKQKNADALALFELNVAEHPESANAHDSLAEGYAISGNKEAAIAHYKKSLALDPSNTNAVQKLKELGNDKIKEQ